MPRKLLTSFVKSGVNVVLDQMKRNNIKQIMLCLMTRGRATKAELVADTGLSMSTVSSCINSLLKLTLLTTDGMEDSSGGRRSTIYSMKPDYGCFVGLDVYSDKIIAIAQDCQANILAQKVFLIPVGEKTINILSEALEQLFTEHENVLGIGIGLSGRINSQDQIIVSAPDVGWEFVHLREIVERQFMTFTYVDHRINGTAVHQGMLNQLNRNNYLYLGEGVDEKAALILDGRLCRGVDNTTGSLSMGSDGSTPWLMMLRFLGVSDLVIGYETDEFKEAFLNEIMDFNGEIHCVQQTETTHAVGIAVAAQREWFESIYFML